MGRVALVALAAAFVLVGARAADSDPLQKLDGVQDLSPSNFDSVVSGKKHALVEFYAPWCGHCKRLVPEFKKLGAKIASDPKLSSRVVIAKVNADEHRSLGERFGVRGFPTLKWFPRGEPKDPEDYQGGRSFSDFVEFIEGKVKADAGFARVDALVPLAREFLDAEDKQAVIVAAEAVAADVPEEDKANAALYIRFLKRALDKGTDWLSAELARLEKLVAKGTSAAKLEEISRKISVLGSILEEGEEDEEGDEDELAAGEGDDGDDKEEGEELDIEAAEEEIEEPSEEGEDDEAEEEHADEEE